MYINGRGVPQDNVQAALWLRKAAEQGNRNAQVVLGGLYSDGQGVPQDNTRAVFWYRKAAEQGDDYAQYHLGGLYDKGRSIPQDYAEAYFWLDLAAAGTFGEVAAEQRDEAASHLTQADLSREQERARKWFEDHPAKP